MNIKSDILLPIILICALVLWMFYQGQQEREKSLQGEIATLKEYVKQSLAITKSNMIAQAQAQEGQISGPGLEQGQQIPIPTSDIPVPNTRPGAFGMPVNLPTRGQPTDFYVVGYLFKPKKPNQMLQLFEKYWGSSRYEYITYNHNNPNITLPVYNHNWDQLTDGDCVKVQGYKGLYTVALYPSPLYNFL